ncbi:MAG: hypothetical protein HYU41_16880 [Candidatus Rokubacteria bacterium]|nr:hypothetical protein [Candidatus Rokubacteria bacterium]
MSDDPLSGESATRLLLILLDHCHRSRCHRSVVPKVMSAVDEIRDLEARWEGDVPVTLTESAGGLRLVAGSAGSQAESMRARLAALEAELAPRRGRPRGSGYTSDGLAERNLARTFADRKAMVRSQPAAAKRRSFEFLLRQLWDTSPRGRELGPLPGGIVDAVMTAKNETHAARLFMNAARGKKLGSSSSSTRRAWKRAGRARRASSAWSTPRGTFAT